MTKEKKTKASKKRKTDKRDYKTDPEKKAVKVKKDIPLQINIIGWFGIAFSSTYLIWGVVSIILSILDRTYADFAENIIILAYGIPVLLLSLGFLNKHRWGWYGLMVVLSFVVIWSIFTFSDIYGILWGLFGAAALTGILLPSVRGHYFSR